MADDRPTDTVAAPLARESATLGRLEWSPIGEPIGSLLTRVAEDAREAIPGADGAGLTIFDRGRADILARSALFVERIDDLQYGIGEGPCITAAAEARTVRSDALESEERWPRFAGSAALLGVHSVLSLPLFSADRVLGTINVYALKAGAFSGDAAGTGEQFAVSAAAAVVNAHVMSCAQRLATNLSLALANQATVDQAIGVLIASESLSPVRALSRLRSASAEQGLPVVVVARRVIEDLTPRGVEQGAG